MSIEKWTAVDGYFDGRFIDQDALLDGILERSQAADLPAIAVAANQGKLLQLLVQIQGAKNILEIGTLAGYSTIWMARALPEDGRLITLEYDDKHASIARENIAAAGLADKVTVMAGNAREILPTLTDAAPFDFIFIDADKPNNPFYIEWCVKLARSGSVIFADNVVREGEVANPDSDDAKVIGTQQMIEIIAADNRLDAMALQTVGAKGYDGFALMRVK